MSCYRPIEAQKARHSVPKLCRILLVSRSGYYAWRKRPPSHRASFDAVLMQKIETIHRIALQQAAPDPVGRSFAADEPDRLWVADITCVRTGEGFLYLAFILDLCSRRVVGWSMTTHLRTELVADALAMTIARRKPSPGLVHHSDRGAQGESTQYTSLSFGEHLQEVGIVPSM